MLEKTRRRALSRGYSQVSITNLHLTVTVGRDEALRARIEEVAARAGRSVEIHGWTTHMPELLMTHHVLIGKAGGATVQECIAARTPMLMTSVVPGQEEGNAQLLFQNQCGALCPTPDALAEKIEQLFANDAVEWRAVGGRLSRGLGGPMRRCKSRGLLSKPVRDLLKIASSAASFPARACSASFLLRGLPCLRAAPRPAQ